MNRKEYLKKYRLTHKEKYREYQAKYRKTHLSTYERLQQENQSLKNRIEKAIARLRGLQQLNNGFGASISTGALEDVIKHLDGKFDDLLKGENAIK